jgi:hypothetical protein
VNFEFNNWSGNWYGQADAAERQAFREWFHGVVRSERVNVSFVKADGTLRHMHCSLHPELIPAEKLQKEEANPRKRSEEALVVWDLDKQDWRSFRFDSIREFSFNLGELHV